MIGATHETLNIYIYIYIYKDGLKSLYEDIIISKMQQTCTKRVEDLTQLDGEGDPLEMVQEIKI